MNTQRVEELRAKAINEVCKRKDKEKGKAKATGPRLPKELVGHT